MGWCISIRGDGHGHDHTHLPSQILQKNKGWDDAFPSKEMGPGPRAGVMDDEWPSVFVGDESFASQGGTGASLGSGRGRGLHSPRPDWRRLSGPREMGMTMTMPIPLNGNVPPHPFFLS